MRPEEKQLLIVVARAVVQCAQWGQNTGINQEARSALSAALARVTSPPDHIEQTPAGIIDWKAEALRTARLLADAESIIAEYKAQAIEAARGVAQTPGRIEVLEAALREIDNMAPATCEVTLAHQMADIASAALAPPRKD
jgi:hypothetical protein